MSHTAFQLPPSSPDAKSARGLAGSVRELAKALLSLGLALAAVALLHTFLAEPFTIPSSSMEPGLVTGDYILVSKFAYGWSGASPPINLPIGGGRLLARRPRRGDVVVFRLPRDPNLVWIKRVIGLPGDRVQVRDGTVLVNGRALGEREVARGSDHDAPGLQVHVVRETTLAGRSYLTYRRLPAGPAEDTGVCIVPKGRYFVMGDNRDNSLDSRWPASIGVGLVPEANLLGRAEVVVASWREGGSLYKPWTWLNLQPGRLLLRVR